jgi:zinc protease
MPLPPPPPIRLPAVEEHRLANGLTLVLHPDQRLPLVTINIWYHVGSKDERPGLTGFAHLFEHMLFQGSEHVSGTDHFRYLQQIGGVANGSTWYDRTNYYETLPAHQLELGLWLESDRMGFFLPGLTSEKLETQRSVVINERRQRVDNQPYGRASERINELLFPPEHPYHWPVIGTLEDIAAASLDDVREFFRLHYTPANAVLTLAGSFEPEAGLEAVERWFGPLASGTKPPPVVPGDPSFTGERRERLTDEVQLARVYLAGQAAAYGEPGWYAADLLARVLTSGKSSVLHEDLVYRRELARNVTAYLLPTELTAPLTIIANANPGRPVEELERAIVEHLDRLAAEGPTEKDLVRARNRVLTGLFEDLQTLDARADLLSQHATFFGEADRAFGEADRYGAVTAEAVRDAARRYLVEGGRAVVTVVPRGEAA